MNQGKVTVNPVPIYFKRVTTYGKADGTAQEELEIEAAIQYNDSYTENLFSFANNINTRDGGTHVSGFRSAITRTINNYAKKNDLLKKFKGDALTGDDLREGLTAIISLKVMNPQFEGQNKGKLLNSEIQGVVESLVSDAFMEYLEENPRSARKIIEKTVLAAQARMAARKAREIVRKSAMGRRIAAGQVGRLLGSRSGELRAVSGRGRFGWRLGQAGARPAFPGDSSFARQDHQCGKSAARQGTGQQRNSNHHHGARNGDRRR